MWSDTTPSQLRLLAEDTLAADATSEYMRLIVSRTAMYEAIHRALDGKGTESFDALARLLKEQIDGGGDAGLTATTEPDELWGVVEPAVGNGGAGLGADEWEALDGQ